MDDAAEELSTSFTKAYEGTLRPFHSMLIRPIFAVRGVLPFLPPSLLVVDFFFYSWP